MVDLHCLGVSRAYVCQRLPPCDPMFARLSVRRLRECPKLRNDMVAVHAEDGR